MQAGEGEVEEERANLIWESELAKMQDRHGKRIKRVRCSKGRRIFLTLKHRD